MRMIKLSEEKIYGKDDELQYISKLIDWLSVFKVKRELWLTEVEKRFFVNMVYLLNRDIDLKGKEALELYKENVGLYRKSDISLYIRKLIEKEWINKKEKDLVLPKFLNPLIKDLNLNITIRLHVDR